MDRIEKRKKTRIDGEDKESDKKDTAEEREKK